MRDVLPEYYELESGEIDLLLDSAIVVMDGNALLGFYNLQVEEQSAVFDLMEAVENRLWVPRAAALEYHENRIRSVMRVASAYEDVVQKVDDMRSSILLLLSEHPVLGSEGIKREVEDRFTSIARYLRDQRASQHEPDVDDPVNSDSVLEKLTSLLDAARLGGDLAADGGIVEERVSSERPPTAGARAWLEALETWGPSGMAASCGMIWVTENKGADWWRLEGDVRLGPRPELVRESRDAGLTPLWLTDVRGLLEHAKRHFHW